MSIKKKDYLFKKLNEYFKDHKEFKMPSFRECTNDSIFFKKNYSKIYKLFYLKNKNLKQNNELDDLVLCSYFSSKKVVNSIKKLNKLDNYKRKLNINNLFDGNKKKIYLKINL